MPAKLSIRFVVVPVALFFLAAAVLPADTKYCPLAGPATAESYTWDFPKEVTETLADFEQHAREIRMHAATLEVMSRSASLYSPAPATAMNWR